jgi:hypothetical protein
VILWGVHMGSNRTQAQGIVLMIVAFVFLAAGFASGGNILWFVIAAAVFGLSVWRFRVCKGWEQREDMLK